MLPVRGIYAATPRAHTSLKRYGSAALRIKLSDPAQLDKLLAFLSFDANAVVTQVARDEVELSFLGSLNVTAQMMESELRLRLWLTSHPDVIAVLRGFLLPPLGAIHAKTKFTATWEPNGPWLPST